MCQQHPVKVIAQSILAILLAAMNTLAMLSWTFSNPAIVSPFVSAGILAAVAIIVIFWFRSGEPPNLTLGLAMFIIFAPILVCALCVPLSELLYVVDNSIGFPWAFEILRFLFVPAFGFMVWIISAGRFYLPVAGVFVVLAWKRADTPIQKGWIILCGLTVAGGLLYNLWWYGTGQKINWP